MRIFKPTDMLFGGGPTAVASTWVKFGPLGDIIEFFSDDKKTKK